MLREEVNRAEERHDSVQQTIGALSEAFEGFRSQYDRDMEAMRVTQEGIAELLNKTVERQGSIMAYVESLQHFEVTAKITKNADSIDAIRYVRGEMGGRGAAVCKLLCDGYVLVHIIVI